MLGRDRDTSSRQPGAARRSAPAIGAGRAEQPRRPASPAAEAATVRLQLQWAPQAQFAGYFAADKQGYFAAENLTSSSSTAARPSSRSRSARRPTAPSSRSRGCPKVLEAREAGSDLVDIAQIFQRSGTLSVAWKDSGIDDPCKFAGKKVGVWDFGNEYEVTAGLRRTAA